MVPCNIWDLLILKNYKLFVCNSNLTKYLVILPFTQCDILPVPSFPSLITKVVCDTCPFHRSLRVLILP